MSLLFSNDLCSAFLAEIIRVFQKKHADHYLGRTAMQKLAYFSQAVGVPIPCNFEIYNFGPYSDKVWFALQSMIADEIIVDKSRNEKYSDYRLNTGGPGYDEKTESFVAEYRATIENVVEELGRFEPPQLELIATLHFIATKIKSLRGGAPKDIVIGQFFSVKGDKFPTEEVSSWYDALKSAHLV